MHTPDPDFERLRRAIRREGASVRVSLLELFADPEIIASVMNVRYTPPADRLEHERWTQIVVQFWYRLGDDAVRLGVGLELPHKIIAATDTAELQRARRNWQNDHEGLIASWEDFERYPWPSALTVNCSN